MYQVQNVLGLGTFGVFQTCNSIPNLHDKLGLKLLGPNHITEVRMEWVHTPPSCSYYLCSSSYYTFCRSAVWLCLLERKGLRYEKELLHKSTQRKSSP